MSDSAGIGPERPCTSPITAADAATVCATLFSSAVKVRGPKRRNAANIVKVTSVAVSAPESMKPIFSPV